MRKTLCTLRVCLLCVALLACRPELREPRPSQIAVAVLKPGTGEVDVDRVVHDITDEVHKVLPRAFAQGMVYSGECQDLPELRGKLVFVFADVTPRLFTDRVLRATATVDTERGTADIVYEDVSTMYPSTKHVPFVDDETIKHVAALASAHIEELGLVPCQVTLTQIADSWNVRCGDLGDFVLRCQFEIVGGEFLEASEEGKDRPAEPAVEGAKAR